MEKLTYIIQDLKDLQTHMLQDLLQMQVDSAYPNDSWREEFIKEIRGYIDDKSFLHRGIYISVENSINRTGGYENYSINSMDRTFIVNCFKYMKCFKKCSNTTFTRLIESTREDRNFDSHMNSNETDDELLQFIYSVITDLEKFTVDVCGSGNEIASAENKIKYDKRYINELKIIKNRVNECRAVLEEFNVSIRNIKKYKQGTERYINEVHREIERYFHDREEKEKYHKFLLRLIEEGVGDGDGYTSVSLRLAENYIGGYGTPKNPERAEYYALKSIEECEKSYGGFTMNMKYPLMILQNLEKNEGYKLNDKTIKYIKNVEDFYNKKAHNQ